jgi:hypothetical protein
MRRLADFMAGACVSASIMLTIASLHERTFSVLILAPLLCVPGLLLNQFKEVKSPEEIGEKPC